MYNLIKNIILITSTSPGEADPPTPARQTTTGMNITTLIIGDEVLASFKSDMRQQCPRGTKIATTEGCNFKEAQAWLMSEESHLHLSSDKIYIFSSIWNVLRKDGVGKLNTYSDSNDSAQENADRLIASAKSLISQIELEYPRRKVIILPGIGLSIDRYNIKGNIQQEAQEIEKLQELIDNTTLFLNKEIVKMNKERGFITPRYDRNMFRYDCRRKKWRVVDKIMDNLNPLLPGAEYKKVIISKMTEAFSLNLFT